MEAKKFTQLPVPLVDADTIFAAEDFPDRQLFACTKEYPALSVPVRETAHFRKKYKNLQVQGIKNVLPDPNDSKRRLVVLKQDVTKADVQQLDDDDDDSTDDNSPVYWWVEPPGVAITRPYKDQSADEILRKLLPADAITEVPSSFELVGHVAHVNLRDEALPYQHWIGQVLLDCNKAVSTVVNKVGTISTEFRTFGMQVIASRGGDTSGDGDTNWSITTVHEHGCSFTLDYQHVYWNSRLAGEHRRLVQLIPAHSVVADLMAGVGPFAVPLAKKKCLVYANDLNPVSFKYLQINAARNNSNNNSTNSNKQSCHQNNSATTKKHIRCSNMDARGFWHKLQDDGVAVDHVIMNLPASAPEFLDAFRGGSSGSNSGCLPQIHVHCFCPKADGPGYRSAVARCEAALGCEISTGVTVHCVRDVSPRKNMICVSFPLPKAAAALPRIQLNNSSTLASATTAQTAASSPEAKRQKL